jgi:hypothetical protein
MSDDDPVFDSGDEDEGGFDSRDCVDFVIEGPGDNTVRPCRPSLLKHMMAEREKLIRYGAMPPPEPPATPPEPPESDKPDK